MTVYLNDYPPVVRDLHMTRNHDVEFVFEIVDKYGRPRDLTGNHVNMTIMTEVGGTVIFSLRQTSHVDPTNGITKFSVRSEYTLYNIDDLDRVTNWVYEVQVNSGTDFEGAFAARTYYIGKVVVYPNIVDEVPSDTSVPSP